MGWTPQPRCYNGRWICRYRGRKHYLGSDMAKAYARFAEIVGRPAQDNPVSVSGAIDQWLLDQGKPADGWEAGLFKTWDAYAGHERLADICDDHLTNFGRYLAKLRWSDGPRKGKLSQSPQTIRHKIRLALAVLRWCHKRDLIRAVPDKPKLPTVVRRPRDPSPQQLRATFQGINDRARRLLTFILETGARPSEARLLKWDDVDLERGQCILSRHKTTRTSKPRRLILTPAARAILKATGTRTGYVFRSRTGKPYTHAGLRSILRSHGLSSVYSLRHARAQSMLDAGVPIEVVSEWLGHSNLATTQVYAQVRSDRLQAVAATLVSPLQDRTHDKPPHETPTAGPTRPAKPKPTRRKPGKARDRRAG